MKFRTFEVYLKFFHKTRFLSYEYYVKRKIQPWARAINQEILVIFFLVKSMHLLKRNFQNRTGFTKVTFLLFVVAFFTFYAFGNAWKIPFNLSPKTTQFLRFFSRKVFNCSIFPSDISNDRFHARNSSTRTNNHYLFVCDRCDRKLMPCRRLIVRKMQFEGVLKIFLKFRRNPTTFFFLFLFFTTPSNVSAPIF